MDLYLSPSLQPYNLYYGGGNEQEYMQRLADEMEPYLRASGISFSRNRIGMTLGDAIRASNAGYYSLHLALHSNAAPPALSGKMRGADAYFYPYSKNSRRAAEIIAKNYKEIYPDPALVRALPTTSLVEITKSNAPAVLIETAYHDNPQDVAWLRESLPAIARNLSKSVAEYLGVPLIEPQGERVGTVATQSGTLNIRSRPSLEAPVIGGAPKGAKVAVWGEWEGWNTITYGSVTGYADADYIETT